MISLSVVIPTYNRVDRLRKVIEGLENQSHPLSDFEVILVSDGSTDGTNNYMNQLTTSLNIRCEFIKNQGAAAARNQGILHARGNYILFIDDDVVPAPQLICEHLRCHGELGENVVVLGPMLTPPGFHMSPWVQWEQLMLEKQYRAMEKGDWAPTARQFYTGNSSLARGHLIEHGGFDTSFRRAEDVELAYRLSNSGLRFFFNPQAVGYHFAERSYLSWLKIPYEYGKNDAIFTIQKGMDWLLPTIFREYHSRDRLIKLLTRVCMDRPSISGWAIRRLEQAMWFGYRSGKTRLSLLACSGIFNLRYYQGLADQVGGRNVFFDRIYGGSESSISALLL